MIRKRKSKLWGLFFYLYLSSNPDDTIVAFGRSIYIPPHKDFDMPHDQLVHENIHLKQQRYSYLYGIICLVRYRISPAYRYKCELEAYRAQIRYIYQLGLPQSDLDYFTEKLAEALSGSLYHHMVSYRKALHDLTL